MKRCSQCKTSPREENGPKFVRTKAGGREYVQVRCGCSLHTGWFATELEAQKEWKDDTQTRGWSK